MDEETVWRLTDAIMRVDLGDGRGARPPEAEAFAVAVIERLARDGFAIVRREPTDAMLKAIDPELWPSIRRLWRQVIEKGAG
jgi:hypothetical protein